jgi:pimeloyl-ACP methyl ester carboxylesterase
LTRFEILGRHLEYRWIGQRPLDAPSIVFLHEGLGCVGTWRDFPERLASATGCGALVYSRAGYGGSDPVTGTRPVRYLHDEALEVLPAVLEHFKLVKPVLFGHSDGASIALIHAGAARWPVRALILEAPHVFTEDMGIAAIEEARVAYASGDLRQRLARYHGDVDGAFRGWNDAWLNPAFRAWNIAEYLPGIVCPVLAIQGADDEYGTLAQLAAIERGVRGAVETLVLANCKHSPHRDQEQAVLAAMAAFIARVGRG